MKKTPISEKEKQLSKKQRRLFRKNSTVSPETEIYYHQMLENIKQTKTDLDCAYSNFEHATDPDLIDCYIYQLKSVQMRYKFLLDNIKQAERCLKNRC